MRIAIDFSSARIGAGIVYARNILAGLARLDSINEYLVLVTPDDRISVPRSGNFRSIGRAPRSAAVRIPYFQAVLPRWLKQQGVNVLVSPFEYSILAAPCPIVLGMQNLSPYWGSNPSTLAGWLRNRAIRTLAGLSVRRATRIFFLSAASRRIICDQLRISFQKTVVIPCGLDADALFVGSNGASHSNVVGQRALSGPYILSVSSVMAHKDFETLVGAFAHLVQRRRIPHRLVIAGSLNDKPYLAKLRSLISSLHLRERVDFLGEVPHGLLGRLYKQADAVVLASRTETFGMPLIEAMACGAPMIASELPALREVGAEASIYYSPGDIASLSEQLELILMNEELRTSMVAAGKKRAAQFSWDAAASCLLTLLNDATNTLR